MADTSVWIHYSHSIVRAQHVHILFYNGGRSGYSSPIQTKLLSVNHSMPYHHLERISERAISAVVYHFSLPTAVSCQAPSLQPSTAVYSVGSSQASQTTSSQPGTAVQHTNEQFTTQNWAVYQLCVAPSHLDSNLVKVIKTQKYTSNTAWLIFPLGRSI